MKNAELEKIIASVDAAVRQAYALGRRDALDHVARWAQTEETTSTQLALVASNGHDADDAPAAAPAGAHATTYAPAPASSRAASTTGEATARPRGFGALLLDYVYPTD